MKSEDEISDSRKLVSGSKIQTMVHYTPAKPTNASYREPQMKFSKVDENWKGAKNTINWNCFASDCTYSIYCFMQDISYLFERIPQVKSEKAEEKPENLIGVAI